MSTPVSVVLDCSNTGAPDPALADRIKQEAMGLLDQAASATKEADKRTFTDAAVNLLEQSKAVLAASALAAETVVDLDAGQIAQRDRDHTEAAAREQAAQQAAIEKAALVAKLEQGKATSDEVQQALAQLLG